MTLGDLDHDLELSLLALHLDSLAIQIAVYLLAYLSLTQAYPFSCLLKRQQKRYTCLGKRTSITLTVANCDFIYHVHTRYLKFK